MSARAFKGVLCALVLLTVSLPCSGEVVLQEGGAVWRVMPDAEFLHDPNAVLTAEMIQRRDADNLFRPFWAESVNMGIENTTYWFRFTARNETQEFKEFYLTLDNPRLQKVMVVDDRGESSTYLQQAGILVKHKDWPIESRLPTFPLKIEPGAAKTVYVRVQNQGSFRFDMQLWTEPAFLASSGKATLMWGIFFGAAGLMGLHSLFVFFVLRDETWLAFLALIVAFALYTAANEGYSYLYLWPDAPWWADRAIVSMSGLCVVGVMLFTQSFLSTARDAPMLNRILLIGVTVGFGLALFNLTGWVGVTRLSYLTGAMAPLLAVGAALWCWAKGNQVARLLVFAWAIMPCASIVLAMVGYGVLPTNLFTENILAFGALLSLSIFSLALVDRVLYLEKNYSADLERQVEERTKELTEATANVETLGKLIPICSSCKSIRDDQGYWNQIESYLAEHADGGLTHSICPSCYEKLYAEEFRRMDEERKK